MLPVVSCLKPAYKSVGGGGGRRGGLMAPQDTPSDELSESEIEFAD